MIQKYLIALSSLFIMSAASASNYYCSDWTKTRGSNCQFAGRSAAIYERQCENPCRREFDWGPRCDREKVCANENPNTLSSVCGEWTKNRGSRCRNPNTGDWEQKWERVCTVGLRSFWCSDEKPEF